MGKDQRLLRRQCLQAEHRLSIDRLPERYVFCYDKRARL